MASGLCIKKGEEIRIDAYVSGSPYPKVTWLRNDEDVTKEPTKKIVPVVKRKTKVCVPTETSESPNAILYIYKLFLNFFAYFFALVPSGSSTRGGVCDSDA